MMAIGLALSRDGPHWYSAVPAILLGALFVAFVLVTAVTYVELQLSGDIEFIRATSVGLMPTRFGNRVWRPYVEEWCARYVEDRYGSGRGCNQEQQRLSKLNLTFSIELGLSAVLCLRTYCIGKVEKLVPKKIRWWT